MGKNRPLWIELSYVRFFAEFYGASCDENLKKKYFIKKKSFFLKNSKIHQKKGVFRIENNHRKLAQSSFTRYAYPLNNKTISFRLV
jgi:hypothetical protein